MFDGRDRNALVVSGSPLAEYPSLNIPWSSIFVFTYMTFLQISCFSYDTSVYFM